jgi:predicted esterase
MESLKLGALEYRRFQTPGYDSLSVSEKRALVLLHGFGVPGTDLVWLAEALVNEEANARSPNPQLGRSSVLRASWFGRRDRCAGRFRR